MNYSIYDILGLIADFDETVIGNNEDAWKQATTKHLQQMDRISYVVPNFSKGLDWLNVSEELSLDSHLKGKLLVLDFFTYCCINCMHILPDLEAVEEEFPANSGVAVVGVHSAKFLNEKVTDNIKSAVLRYNILHPVVNDKNADLWQALAVSCWPTLVFVGPNGQLLYSVAGEGHREKVINFLKVATAHYSGQLNGSELPMKYEKDKVPTFSLNFPGKICTWPEKKRLVIADTGNHRIVVTDFQGIVKHVIGCGQAGRKDGVAADAQFFSPQGVACHNNSIYVADTGNHLLRQIVFEGDQTKVSTLAGTGHQGTDKEGGQAFTAQELASPWDVLVSTTPEGSTPVLYIAMAGTHQIWVLFLADGLWYNGKSYPHGTCVRFAGNGLEQNRNNSYPEKASFAQPSGMALSPEKAHHTLYIADSESSSIRSISLSSRKVSGLVGGEKDPTNLFAFGDADGKGCDAKLQHPLGVAVVGDTLLVADSYNHKIKSVDLNSSTCQTLAGTGSPGTAVDANNLLQCQFNEPGGLAVDNLSKMVYVADTNNHAIKVLDLEKNSLHELPVIFPEDVTKSQESTDNNAVAKVEKVNGTILPAVTARASERKVQLLVPIELSPGEHLNADAPNSWKLSGQDESAVRFLNTLSKPDRKGALEIKPSESSSRTHQVGLHLQWPDSTEPGSFTLGLTLQVFVCLDEGNVCLPPRTVPFTQQVNLI